MHLTITARDSGGVANGGVDTSAPQTATIRVSYVNQVPRFVIGSPVTCPRNAGSFSRPGWVTGIAAGPTNPLESTQHLRFDVTVDHPELFQVQPAIDAQGTLTFLPADTVGGTATLSVVLHDDGGTLNGGVDTSPVQTSTIQIVPVNHAPSFMVGADVSLAQDAVAQVYPGWATSISAGPDELSLGVQTVSFVVNYDFPGMFLVPPSIAADGTLSFTLSGEQYGEVPLTIIARDNGGVAHGGVDTSAPQTATIRVSYVNRAPRFTLGWPLTVPRNQGVVSLFGWATGIAAGPNNPLETAQQLTFTVTVDHPELFLVQPILDPSGTLTFTPADTAGGIAQITVTLRDDGGTENGGVDSAPAQSTTIQILPVNHQPSLTAGTVTVPETSISQAIANWVAFDPGIAHESAQFPVEYLATVSNSAVFSVQPRIDLDGTLRFTPANNIDETTVVDLSIQVRDSGGTGYGGSDLSAPVSGRITLTPVADQVVVGNTANDGPGSLRAAIQVARRTDTIVFDPEVFDLVNSNAATVINLYEQLPYLTHGGLTIDASDRRVTINGTAAGSANGLVITSAGNVISGLSFIGFTGSGIVLTEGAHDNVIGGLRSEGTGPNGRGLRLADNGIYGVQISGPSAVQNMVLGCWIGVNAAGSLPEPNLAGILIEAGASYNTIGSDLAGGMNLISGNTFEGITLTGTGTTGNVIIGNGIGVGSVDPSSSTGERHDVGNGAAGVFISRGCTQTRVGASGDGSDDALGNIIANNGANGIEVRSLASSGNRALANRFWGNQLGAIALYDGANHNVQPPIIAEPTVNLVATSTARSVTGGGNLHGTTTGPGVVEIYANAHGQGRQFLGRATVTGTSWSLAIAASDAVVGTYTDAQGNTSAFSPPSNQPQNPPPPPPPNIIDSGNSSGGCGFGSGLACCLLGLFLLGRRRLQD